MRHAGTLTKFNAGALELWLAPGSRCAEGKNAVHHRPALTYRESGAFGLIFGTGLTRAAAAVVIAPVHFHYLADD